MRDFQNAVDQLLGDLGVSRIILRLETPGAFYPVVAEAVADGIRRVATGPEPDFSEAATFKFITGELRPLVQDDVAGHPLSPPADIVGHYGVRSQLLVPVVRGDRFVGVVGIHVAEGPRQWSDEHIATADRFARWVGWELELEDLREQLNIARTTLRIYTGEQGPYFPIAAEALGEGVNSLRQETGLDLRKALTMQRLLARPHETMVQEDLLEADPPPPPELIERYGARAQVLVPIADGESLLAFVSAHHAATPRVFTDAEIRLVEESAERLGRTLAPRPPGGR
jgi:GAF domain-containing protein